MKRRVKCTQRLRVVFQVCAQLDVSKFVTEIHFTVDVSAKVCDGKESAGICQEVSTGHAGLLQTALLMWETDEER